MLTLADDQAALPSESFAEAFQFPADASASYVMPTPEGSPEVKRLSYHEPGKHYYVQLHPTIRIHLTRLQQSLSLHI